jgi:hypothetical protein
MKRLKKAWQTTEGKIFLKKREAEKAEYQESKAQLCGRYFGGYPQAIDRALAEYEKFLAEFHRLKAMDKKVFPEKSNVDEEIPF